MFQKVSDILENTLGFNINDFTMQYLDKSCNFVEFQKETIIVWQGDMSSNMYFIVHGLIRGYYIDESGYEITKCFSKENEFFSTECFRTDAPSSFNIECLEGCLCIQIPYNVLKKIIEKDNNFLMAFNKYVLKIMEDLEKRTKDLVMFSAKERYKTFLEQYPNLNQRVNQKYIASYIGIREASLSRIKKSIDNF